MESLDFYQKEFNKYLRGISFLNEPKDLYNPINYILKNGGKRIRPVLTLMACESVGKSFKNSLEAATAIELFHNFSLMHDDIMDSAMVRRGKETAHKIWGVNSAILSGDALFVLSYQRLKYYSPDIFYKLTNLLSETALFVCEGQSMDLGFETINSTSIDDYLKMIKLKTAVLIGCALKMGSIVGDTSIINQDLFYDFGVYLGIAFQLQDDFLDLYGDKKTFGKEIGGDILENKKTILYHISMMNSNSEQKTKLLSLYSDKKLESSKKINLVKNIFNESKVKEHTTQIVAQYTQKSISALERISISDLKKSHFKYFAKNLMSRSY
jgi:geranylgeranyl diphosphate synthase type II